ncbi:aromatic ring-hydroxylating dioxygenase subunit alpha [Novosphingobium sp. KCTC 2891]|uniref:aromatic ring-hydroxylating oxygenase subunit alpha n=1 Tax=Novosphingobium sp. KCTC 2891 TaxID=2989730 RepID=UPI0022220BB2|nr:aromatic ring-hydroxylating dioxygenase subunit alpha [Novosphingobium sp. KCTC 2891]MCW1384477.1 aromatic ring-hydroxylating dioxygenase subunit alpha [Novosphingobium sp. KCTC 2891]
MTAMANPDIARIMRHSVQHARDNTYELVDEVLKVPASNYTDPGRFKLEVDRIFHRLPLMLAPSCELPNPGDFKTMDVAGVPVLLTRGQDGKVRSFINSCTHRGTNVATAPTGNARRFTCPYHGWTFGQNGELLAIASAADFGEVDKSCLSLKALPVAERAGLIFGSVDPDLKLDIDDFLCGYDALLEAFNFKDWHLFSSRVLRGPNWKIAYDGYLDFYHLPVLHKDTLNASGQLGNRAHYHAWGPHQRLVAPDRAARELGSKPEEQWTDDLVLNGVWTIFPCISIASFNGGGRGVMISQLLPGETVGESWTRQIYLMEKKPSAEQEAAAHEQFAFLEVVVRDEDYDTGLRQQRALDHGTLDHVLFGRNEGGAQAFHKWTDRIIAASDDELSSLFPARAEAVA